MAVSLYCLCFVFIVFGEILFGGGVVGGRKPYELLRSGSLCQKVSVFVVNVTQFVAKTLIFIEKYDLR